MVYLGQTSKIFFAMKHVFFVVKNHYSAYFLLFWKSYDVKRKKNSSHETSQTSAQFFSLNVRNEYLRSRMSKSVMCTVKNLISFSRLYYASIKLKLKDLYIIWRIVLNLITFQSKQIKINKCY